MTEFPTCILRPATWLLSAPKSVFTASAPIVGYPIHGQRRLW